MTQCPSLAARSIACSATISCPLSQGDVVEVTVVAGEAHLLAEGLDVLERVHARGEDEEHRGLRTRLLVRLGELHGLTLRVLAS